MATIELKHGYRGYKSNEKFIPPGIYDDHDPLIMPIVAYLVKNGHATILDNSTHVEPEHESEPLPEIEFTTHAVMLLNETMLTVDDVTPYFVDKGMDKVTKSDIQAYLDDAT